MFMCLTLSCLIVLLSASFAFAGQIEPSDIPSGDAIIEAIKDNVKRINPYIKGHGYLGRFLDEDGTYLVFISGKVKKTDVLLIPIRLIKLDTGVWVAGNLSYGYAQVK